MREIKFRAWNEIDKAMIDWSTIKVFESLLKNLMSGKVRHHQLMQYTGLKDKNGKEIYFGDLLNVYYTSNDGEHIHDCVYQVKQGVLGIELDFVNILWEQDGHNQYPLSSTLCERYRTLDYNCKDNSCFLVLPDSWGKNHMHGSTWKSNDRSEHFEIIGNIYQNPELLEP